MAFLCPVRIRRGKRKKEGDKLSSRTPSIGRITGSASIETLVRVGIEKENGLSPDSKVVVLHDFTPCVDDELEVRRGQVVNVLYQENDWVYVIAENSQEGFIPHSYCAPYGTQPADLALNVKHKKLPRNETEHELDQTSSRGTLSGDSGGQHSDAESFGGAHQVKKGVSSLGLQNSQSSSQVSLPNVHPFFKDPAGRFIVLYTFIARDENDVSVERGELVTVMNREDPDWFWIVRSDGQEGFVPSAFVYPADAIQEHVGQQVVNPADQTHPTQSLNNNHHPPPGAPEDLRCHGSELVMLYDYKAQAPDDLSVRRGDWVYADLNNQTVDGWLWAYAPKTRKYGFIPKAYARPPAMTSL
ncbi:SH3 domain-containing protein Dlish-like [Limulus polyphemus]|uniref:SH3 domain-containing protein Dlish-like n=1 Tax=Limulus polyphemus TaxID=6850 RepID=A0ABM1SHU3_LIMPO|nr:SH3 domain-containing protein Dlish-like [Limulus polyphemus]XP_022243198.1 SH3 domain-containing protein Dlish-like [Limulus polyphemus]XP_022243199.1 SH3 domain-containing protein Dlish-like [Limulus polyphemus]